MADTAFTVKANNETIVLDRITLGDWRMFKTEFGLKAGDISTSLTNDKGESVEVLNLDDPNVLIALIVAAKRHERPHAALSDLIAEVESYDMEGLSFPDAEPASDEAEVDADPKAEAEAEVEDGDVEATDSPAKSGKSAKRPKTPGTQR